MYPILDIILALVSSWVLIMCEKKTREQLKEEKPASHAPSTGSSSASTVVQLQRSTASSTRKSVVKKGSAEFIKRNVKKLQDTFWAPLRETQTTTKAHDDERPSKKAKKARRPEFPDSYQGVEEAEEEKRKAKPKEDRLVFTLKPKEQPELNRKALMIALGAKRVESAYPTLDDIESDWGTEEDRRSTHHERRSRRVDNKVSLEVDKTSPSYDSRPSRMKFDERRFERRDSYEPRIRRKDSHEPRIDKRDSYESRVRRRELHGPRDDRKDSRETHHRKGSYEAHDGKSHERRIDRRDSEPRLRRREASSKSRKKIRDTYERDVEGREFYDARRLAGDESREDDELSGSGSE